jgi:hypothetical protein
MVVAKERWGEQSAKKPLIQGERAAVQYADEQGAEIVSVNVALFQG